DIFLVIGTSLQVYPAASLIHYIPKNCDLFVIDPHLENNFAKEQNFFKLSATEGMRQLKDILTKKE
ncbi:MAG TPA: NAD-dependent deacylase, partial [Kaistella sp.]|nr:NAD-dependent deacylase [Kaistella sp.]